jgi:hypothetical protein
MTWIYINFNSEHAKLFDPGGCVSELVMNIGGLGVLEMVLVRPDWVRRSNPRMCLGPYSAEAMETFQELMVSMTVLHAERPQYFNLDMAQMGRAWSEERERSWSDFTLSEQVREAGRRYDVVHAMRDQYAWRSCVLCRGYIEDIHEIHLARPCGHQTHEPCFRQWSAATATLMGGDHMSAGMWTPDDNLRGGIRPTPHAGDQFSVWGRGSWWCGEPTVP